MGSVCQLSPGYCDIIITRYRNLFGKDHAVTLIDDGRSFDAVAADRVKPKEQVA